MKELLQPLEKMDRSGHGLVVVCLDLKSSKEANPSTALSGHQRMIPSCTLAIRIWLLSLPCLATSRFNGRHMMASSWQLIGIQRTIWLFPQVKTVNIEFGTSSEGNCITHCPMTMSSHLSSGHQLENISQLVHLKCSVYVIKVAGRIHLTNQTLDHFLPWVGAMMVLWYPELVVLVL